MKGRGERVADRFAEQVDMPDEQIASTVK